MLNTEIVGYADVNHTVWCGLDRTSRRITDNNIIVVMLMIKSCTLKCHFIFNFM